ncbi:NAD(P)H-binding protein [Kribbella sp. NPDC003505]|uniref:NmrA family NAD(P)-binding protein n=1 Tax=Kribbella sp. NPDC003505 TaxID=3154448 RepID=UPI0033ABBB10
MSVVVTGATGVVGRPIVRALKDQGVSVRAVARSVGAFAGVQGVDEVAADLSRPETLAPALQGASALFVHPRAVGESAGKLMALAAEHGIQRVVVLSAMNVDDDPVYQPSRLNGDRNKEVEEAVIGSGLPWVAVRASSFATNVVGMFAAQIRAGDVVRGPYGNFAESLLHEADLAAVIARGLLDDDLDGRKVQATGPQSLTHEQMVAVIAEVTGRQLRFEEVRPQVAAQGLIAHGLPEPFVIALMERYERGVGRPADVTDEVAQILGRRSLTFADWVVDHADAFSREA